MTASPDEIIRTSLSPSQIGERIRRQIQAGEGGMIVPAFSVNDNGFTGHSSDAEFVIGFPQQQLNNPGARYAAGTILAVEGGAEVLVCWRVPLVQKVLFGFMLIPFLLSVLSAQVGQALAIPVIGWIFYVFIRIPGRSGEGKLVRRLTSLLLEPGQPNLPE